MADQSDVEQALVTLIGTILDPTTSSHALRIYRGFPNSTELDADLDNSIYHVTVTEQPGFTRLSGGYLDPPTAAPGIVTLTATVSGATVTLGGTPGLGQFVGVVVDGRNYGYALTANDTLATAATALAALIGGGQLATYDPLGLTDYSGNPLQTNDAASATGPVITIATNRPLVAHVGATGTETTYNRWQIQGFRISIWAPTPSVRDSVAKSLDGALSAIRFLTLPDGQGARLEWRNTYSDDMPSKEQLWRRDLYYTVQYATSSTITVNPIVVTAVNVNGQAFNRPAPI